MVSSQDEARFINSMNWLMKNMSHYNFQLSAMIVVADILREAETKTIELTGCTKEKFASIFKQKVLDFEEQDRHIFECYCDCLDEAQRAHQ